MYTLLGVEWMAHAKLLNWVLCDDLDGWEMGRRKGSSRRRGSMYTYS